MPLAQQGKSVADWQHAHIDPIVAMGGIVDGANCLCVVIIVARVGDPALPQHVVDSDHATGAKKDQGALVICGV